jgi:HD-like signal output (HDOD) protein
VRATTSNSTAYREKALQSLALLPPFSPILTKLMASMAREDVSIAELSDWIEKDTVITGHVMRLVNSAAFGRGGTISSVRHGLAIIGLIKLRNVILGMSVCRMWSQVRTPKGWSNARFNLHATACALLCDLIAQYRSVEFGEGAFLGGMLHDIGKLLMAAGLPDEYQIIQEMHEATERPLTECENEIIGITHPELSRLVLEKWNLPTAIRRGVEFHHHPLESVEGELSLSQTIAIADQAVNILGISVGLPKAAADPAPLLRDTVGDRTEIILKSFHTEFDALKSFF